jgi:hypothetical protein
LRAATVQLRGENHTKRTHTQSNASQWICWLKNMNGNNAGNMCLEMASSKLLSRPFPTLFSPIPIIIPRLLAHPYVFIGYPAD